MGASFNLHGAIRPIMTFDGYTDFQGLCFDAETLGARFRV